MKYELTDNDKFVIRVMKELYGMEPTFYENGFYSYDTISNPSFNNARFDIIKKCYCGQPVDITNPDCVQFNLCKDHAMDA